MMQLFSHLKGKKKKTAAFFFMGKKQSLSAEFLYRKNIAADQYVL